MAQPRFYKGIDLLDRIFEFIAMTPNSANWNLNALKSNPPRYIRLQRIESLIKAFFEPEQTSSLLEKATALFTVKKGVTIQNILSGDFIKERTNSEYTELINYIKNIVKEKEGVIDQDREVHVMELIMPYQHLMRYKRQLIELLSFNSGWLESGSVTSRFSIYLTDSISGNLVDKFNHLDTALELFINPKQLTFSEDELKSKFKFPIENLRDVDIDFM